MLETAKALSANAGGDEITWHEASAEEMPLPDDHFDAVLCSFGVMFFADMAKGLGEMVRVAKPGGTVACAFFAGPLDRSPYMKAQAERLDPMLEAGVLPLAHGAFRIQAEQVAAILTELGVTNVAADTLEPIAELPAAREHLLSTLADSRTRPSSRPCPIKRKNSSTSRSQTTSPATPQPEARSKCPSLGTSSS